MALSRENLDRLLLTLDVSLSPPLQQELMTLAGVRSFVAGQQIVVSGTGSQQVPMVLSGTMKVSRTGRQQGEQLLYYLEAGDLCTMAMNCCLGIQQSNIVATSEGPTEIVFLPREAYDTWLSRFPEWKTLVFGQFNLRFEELIETLDSLAFRQMDERLMKYLRNLAMVTRNPEIRKSHQEIADDLNSSRVVISRLLKQLEKKGMISLGRQRLTVYLDAWPEGAV